MKKLICIIIVLMAMMPSCKKDKVPLENEIRFTLNGTRYTCITDNMWNASGETLLFFGADFGPSNNIRIYLHENGNPITTGTYTFAPGKYRFGMVMANAVVYFAGEADDVAFKGSGSVNITRYSDVVAEGTFAFASDYEQPFAVTDGFFRIRAHN